MVRVLLIDTRNMNPYKNLVDSRFWRNGVVEAKPYNLVDIHAPKWPIQQDDVFVTMGSCFAQHIGNSLRKQGYNVPFFDIDHNIKSRNFSANYGNIYTTRQALQMVKEALGKHEPSEIAWPTEGGFIDALRPNVFVRSIEDEQTVRQLRKEHLATVREALSSLDVLVFTLGLTETWLIKECGTALPTAPGVLGGTFDPERYEFRNLSFAEVLSDLQELDELVRDLRGGKTFSLLLTVSPVPLTATAENHHILQSSNYSKAVLRAVAGEYKQQHDHVDYFPSFEIITNPAARTNHFEKNLRSVKMESVNVVMDHFNRAYFGGDCSECGMAAIAEDADEGFDERGDVDCEDALLEQFSSTHSEQHSPASQANVLFFGNSHMGVFKNCIDIDAVRQRSVFVPYNFLSNDPFKDIEQQHFREFTFTDTSPFENFKAPNLEYLCVVGFGLFGDGLLRSLGALLPGYEGCYGADITPRLDIVDEVSDECKAKFEKSIKHRLVSIKRVAEHAGFRKIWWVVSPDLTVDVARFRLGDVFVDSGAYKVYKKAYEDVFWNLVKSIELEVDFMFHDKEQYCEKSGFVASRYTGRIPWDIHSQREFFTDKANEVQQELDTHKVNQSLTAA